MLFNDVLMFIHNYRLQPKPEEAHHLFTYVKANRLLWNPKTSIAFAGVITAICDKHPMQYEVWKKNFGDILSQAYSISRSRAAKDDTLWAEYLANRLVILGTDEEAWDLLMFCHYAPNESQRTAAQSACSNLMLSVEGKSMTDSKGNLVGKTYFEDLRLQLARLAREFSRMTPNERKQPFSRLSWTLETQQEQFRQSAGLPSFVM